MAVRGVDRDTPSARARADRDVDLIQSTLRLGQPRAAKPLGQEAAREIAENLVGFFRVLAEWDAKERPSESADDNNGVSELPPREAHDP